MREVRIFTFITVIQVGKIGSKEIIAPDMSQASQSWMLESATHIKLPANIFNGK